MESVEEMQSVSLTAENVGGITRTDVEFDRGVTILAGRNATHRTSFLQAVMAALGSDRASLKGSAEQGSVRMEVGDDVYTRQLDRRGETVSFDGEPYLDDPELADLFAFLLESNEARRTVALEGDLREILMKPVDADSIRSEIRELESEKRDLEERIRELDSRKRELTDLDETRQQLERDMEDVRDRLAAKRDELDEESTDASEAEAEQTELNAKMTELQRTRSDLDRLEFQIRTQQDSIETLEEERERLETKRADLDTDEHVDIDGIESEIRRLRDRKQSLGTELSKLQNVIQFNEEMLDGASQDIAAALRDDDPGDGNVTDRLLEADETVVCWTCGEEVGRERIEATLDRLRDLRRAKHRERSDDESRIEELQERRDEIRSDRRERERVAENLADVCAEIDDREAKLADLRDQRADLEAEIETLEAEIEKLEAEDRSEVLDVHRRVNELEVKLEALEDEHDRVVADVKELEAELERIDDLEAERDDVQTELVDLRTKIEQIEEQAVEEFNVHMETVLTILDYANLDRIWVERTERTVREGRQKVTKSQFDLHVVRSTPDGVTYEDEFSHLSESEREVTGLVFALAGYLAHEVYEEVPFMLLDSLEAIDSDRIAKLVEYFEDYAEYLIVALLTEDAAALDESYQRIGEI